MTHLSSLDMSTPTEWMGPVMLEVIITAKFLIISLRALLPTDTCLQRSQEILLISCNTTEYKYMLVYEKF